MGCGYLIVVNIVHHKAGDAPPDKKHAEDDHGDAYHGNNDVEHGILLSLSFKPHRMWYMKILFVVHGCPMAKSIPH